MAIADPKQYVKGKSDEEPAPQALTVADLIMALQALKGDDDESLRKRAQYEAEAHARLTRRENEQAPGISVYRPLGVAAYPNLALKCRMFWVGYPLQDDNLTPEEIALLNRAERGEYTFHKTDGSESKLTVTGETDARGEITRLLFHFPCRGDNRHNLPSMTAMLREVFDGQAETDLRAELERLRAELARTAAH